MSGHNQPYRESFKQKSSISDSQLPSPEILQQLKEISPDIAKRILDMAESQNEYFIESDRIDQRNYWFYKSASFITVVVIMLVVLWGTYDLFKEGLFTAGIAGVIGSVGTVLAVMLRGANKNANS